MAALTRHARLLYVIALFQLLGGPLMLGGLVLVSRMAGQTDLTLAERINEAAAQMQRLEAMTFDETERAAQVDEASSVPVPGPAPIPAKTKEGKIKLFAVTGFLPPRIVFDRQAPAGHPRWHVPAPATRGHAPPIPPPRAQV